MFVCKKCFYLELGGQSKDLEPAESSPPSPPKCKILKKI